MFIGTDGTCEDRRLEAAGYFVCGSNEDREWHWRGPDQQWRDGYRSEYAAVNAALRHLRNLTSHKRAGSAS